eukprot:scaffold197512_cov22-Tisochrysis_lutea.AAC.1
MAGNMDMAVMMPDGTLHANVSDLATTAHAHLPNVLCVAGQDHARSGQVHARSTTALLPCTPPPKVHGHPRSPLQGLQRTADANMHRILLPCTGSSLQRPWMLPCILTIPEYNPAIALAHLFKGRGCSICPCSPLTGQWPPLLRAEL